MVLGAIAIIAPLVFEFGTNTTMAAMATANVRDSMRAHFLNRSGANLAQLIIKIQTDVLDRNRKQIGDIQLTDYVSLFMGVFAGTKEERDDLLNMLGGFDADAIEGLGVSGGTFDLQISTEDGKLNMNCANGSQGTRNNIKTQLDALVYFEAYNPIFENADAEGWRRDRSEQVSALMDYIDRDRSRADRAGTPEDYGYESLDDKYKAKDNYIDSVGELKLARGVDDRFWTLFGSEFTIYGDCKVNIGAVQDPKLIASIIFLSAKNPEDPVLQDPIKLWRLASRVAEARGFGIYFDDLSAFADYVKNPDGALTDLLAGEEASGLDASQLMANQGVEPIEGVELDPVKLGQVARTGPRRTYRVEVTSTIEPPGGRGIRRLSRTLTAIWDTQVQNQNMRDPSYSRGSWVFWREE